MKLISLSISFLFISTLLFSQEFIPSELEISTQPVSECSVCDGSCSVVSPEPGFITYRWDDSDGNLITIESSDNGQSEIFDLCIGAYKVTISSGSEVVGEAFFSITEESVSLGEPGTIYSCSNLETVSLTNLMPADAAVGGNWYNDLGLLVSDLTITTEIGGVYTYVLDNGGCQNFNQIPLVINNPANVGEFPNVQICEDFESFDFWVYADSDNYPEPNGVFLNEDFQQVVPFFNPQDSLPGEYNYVYIIDTVPGCAAPIDPFFIRVNAFNNAGADAEVYFCSTDDQELDLSSFLSEDANADGLWYNESNQLIDQIIEGELIEEGAYRYTVTSNVPCLPDVSYVDVVIIEDANAVNDISAQVCSDSDEIILSDLLDEDMTENGIWLDSEGDEILGVFNPQEEQNSSFTFQLEGIGCENSFASLTINVEENQFLSETIATQICELQSQINLNNYVNAEVLNSESMWIDEDGEEITTITVTPNIGNNIYTLQETGLTVCQSNSISLDVEQVAFNDAGTGQTIELCSNEETLDLTDMVMVPGEWSWNNTELSSGEILLIQANSGLYEFTAENNAVCPESSIILELILQDPFVYNQIEDVSLCAGEDVIINTPSSGVNFTTYWELNGEIVTSEQVELTNLSESTFTVPYQIINGICEISDEFTVTVFPELELDILGESIVCEGDEFTLEVSNETLVNWSENAVLIGQGSSSFSAIAQESAFYSVTGESVNGCVAMDEFYVQVNEAPDVEINASPLTGCAPFQVDLLASSSENSENQYQWIVDGTPFSGASLSLDVEEGEEYEVVLITSNSYGCTSSVDLGQTIVGYVLPHAKFEVEDNSLSYLNPLAEIENESEDYDVLNWSIDGESINGGSDTWSYLFSDEPYEIYELCLEAITAEGCIDKYCETISVDSELLLYIPNAFTPDGDGLNDVFQPSYSGNSKNHYELMVFDRWGQQVFFTQEVNDYWVGNINGGDYYAPPGVYTYILTIKDEFTTETEVHTGHVTLLR